MKNMIHRLFLSGVTILSIMSFSCDKAANNPLFFEFKTPYETPPFDQIKDSHFLPAIKDGIKQQKEEIDAIVKNTETPTFQNTIVALENSGRMLHRANLILSNMCSAKLNPELEKIQQEATPLIAQQSNWIIFNPGLFAKVKAVFQASDSSKMDPQDYRLLKVVYRNFVKEGANLSDDAQKKLGAMNEKIAGLEVSFSQNLQAEMTSFKLVVEKKADLQGIPAPVVEAAAETANSQGLKGKWVFTLRSPSFMPFMTYCKNRDLRKKMLDAYSSRCNHDDATDNKKNITELLKYREQKAKLLGYPSFAHYSIRDLMAKNPEAVQTRLASLWAPALENAKKEAASLQALLSKDVPSAKLAAYDWRYYEAILLKNTFAFNEEDTKVYLELSNVTQGIFTVAKKLYGLSFEKTDNISRYHPDVETFKVIDSDGTLMGVLYLDLYAREGKSGGAWMTEFRGESYKNGKREIPLVSLVCNFPKPSAKTPSLLSLDDVHTFFHEFGHGLHGLLANSKYESISGTNVVRDFVELPSQVMENWAFEPQVLALYAKHYKTGKIMPAELSEKIAKSGTFGQGFATVEYLAACYLDMNMHTLTDASNVDVNGLEKSITTQIGLIPEILPRYRATYFLHPFSHGYEAGYYSYIWAAMLDADAFEAFKETGDLFNEHVAVSFRKNILEKGNTEDAMELYKKFRGAEPTMTPLLKRRGLLKN